MSYDIKNLEKPEDRKKGVMGTTLFHIILLLMIIWPWFTTITPIPEPEGLMASFGEVEIAGGSNTQQEQQEEIQEQQEVIQDEPVEEIEEVETIEDNSAPEITTEDKPIVEDKPTVEDQPAVDPNSMFSGNNSGNGQDQGDGKVGNPKGKDDLGNTGNGQGEAGDGISSSRRVIKKCADYQQNNASWQEKGTAVVTICINAQGRVTSAKINRKASTITSQKLISLVEGCAQNYRYTRAPGTGEVCGDIIIKLGVN